MPPKFVKGSKEAKEYMANMRAMRGKKVKGGSVELPDAHTGIEPANRDVSLEEDFVGGGLGGSDSEMESCWCDCQKCGGMGIVKKKNMK